MFRIQLNFDHSEMTNINQFIIFDKTQSTTIITIVQIDRNTNPSTFTLKIDRNQSKLSRLGPLFLVELEFPC